MRLIVHIGFHKTGTSAFQKYCCDNYDALIENGLLFPIAGRSELILKSTSTSEAGHRKFAKVLSTPKGKFSSRLLARIAGEARKAGVKDVIISSETMSAPRVRIAKNLPEVLLNYFDEVAVLAYVRRQDEWANSFYREFLCWPRQREKRDFGKFCEEYLKEWLDFEERLARWSDIFGQRNMIVKSYDDRVQRDIVLDIINSIGKRSEHLPVSGKIGNPSLPINMINFVRELNKKVRSNEQKASITHELFERLQKSTLTTEVKPLRSHWLDNNREHWAAANKRIAEKYNMGGAEKFCSVAAKPSLEMIRELTLSKETLESLRDPIGKEDTILLSGRANGGGWGVTCLCNEGIAQTGVFIDYHLALGAGRIIMFLDNPEDPIQSIFRDDRVEFVRCTEDFWLQENGRLPENNAEKLSLCHTRGLEWLRHRDNLDWAVNVDADELIWVEPDRKVSDVLREIGKVANQMILPPLEAIFVDDEDADLFRAKYFKVLRRPQKQIDHIERVRGKLKVGVRRIATGLRHVPYVGHRLAIRWLSLWSSDGRRSIPLGIKPKVIKLRRWSDDDAELYLQAMPVASSVLRDGFLGHRQGRVITAHGVKLDAVKSHRHQSTSDTIVRTDSRGLLSILHYDAVNYKAWHLKWHRRVFGGANVLKIGKERKMQQSMFADAAASGTTEKLFRDLFFLPHQWLPEFIRQHLVVEITPPGIEEISRKWMAIEAGYREEDAVQDAADKAR